MENKKCVTDFLGNGLMMPRMRVELGEDIEIGTLVGIKEGKLVKATNKANSDVKALTAITRGSTRTVDDPVYYKGTNVLKAGESHEIYPCFVIQNVPSTEVDFETAKFGDPVYLGVDGKMTTTEPSEENTLIQVVGYVGDALREEVVCHPLATVAVKAKA